MVEKGMGDDCAPYEDTTFSLTPWSKSDQKDEQSFPFSRNILGIWSGKNPESYTFWRKDMTYMRTGFSRQEWAPDQAWCPGAKQRASLNFTVRGGRAPSINKTSFQFTPLPRFTEAPITLGESSCWSFCQVPPKKHQSLDSIWVFRWCCWYELPLNNQPTVDIGSGGFGFVLNHVLKYLRKRSSWGLGVWPG